MPSPPTEPERAPFPQRVASWRARLPPRVGGSALLLAGAAALGLALRVVELGNVFQTSDNVTLAWRVLSRPGWAWMVNEYYGLVIYIVVKLFTATVSAVGIPLNEFWWKLPVALVGLAQVPLAYTLLRSLTGSRGVGVCAALLLAVLPIHVFQSRYLWGYEVFGALFLTLALWALVHWARRPDWRRGQLAGWALALYLCSHVYIQPLPLALGLLGGWAAWCWGGGRPLATARRYGLLALKQCVWLPPLIFLPLYRSALEHGGDETLRLGFYVPDYWGGFAGNLGLPLLAAVAAGLAALPWASRAVRGHGVLLLLVAVAYLGPFAVAAPPSATVERGYLTVGTVFLVMGAAAGLTVLGRRHRAAGPVALALVVAGSVYGVVESALWLDRGTDPTLVRSERGSVEDPGTKAAAYLVRRYAPASARGLSLHRRIEKPNYFYYFAGMPGTAYKDRSIRQLRDLAREKGPAHDILLAETHTAGTVEAELGDTFARRAVIEASYRGGGDPLTIFVRRGMDFPSLHVDAAGRRRLNQRFDEAYGPSVAFW